MSKSNIDYKLMVPAIAFVLAVMVLAAMFPETMNGLTGKGASFITHQLGFLIQFVAVGCGSFGLVGFWKIWKGKIWW